MTTATATTPASPSQGARWLEVAIKGRIDAIRLHNGVRYTRITTPAADEYSRPQTIEVRSKAKLGEREEVVQVRAKLGGFARKPFKSTDQATGEITMVTPVDLTLDAVE